MIVADTNLITYLVVQGPLTPLAEAVAATDIDWRAPGLWRSELVNTLAGYLRRGDPLDDIRESFHKAEAWIRVDVATDFGRVFELVAQSECTAYDCEFVAAAEALKCPLVTNDKQILRAFPNIAQTMEQFLAA